MASAQLFPVAPGGEEDKRLLLSEAHSFYGSIVEGFMLKLLTLTLLASSLSFATRAEPAGSPMVVRVPYLVSQDINHEDYYFSELLRLALERSAASGEVVDMQQKEDWLRDQRLRQALLRGEVDVLWSQTGTTFERIMLPVRIPLLKGLSQYRLLLIRAGDQPRFNQVKSLQDLAQLRGGIGSQWPDVAIMKANGLQLVTAPGYGKLFRMLAAGRFDYFSRGIYQIQSEAHFYPTLPLAIEHTLLLRQRGAMYFFVAPENTALAQRIERGLQAAKSDGSFDKLFNSVPRYHWALRELERGGRRVLDLKPVEG